LVFPVFSEASGNLGLQPFARIDQIEACRPHAMSPTRVPEPQGIGQASISGYIY